MSENREQYFDETKVAKLEGLRENGIEPFPYIFRRTHTAGEIKERFSGIDHDKSEDRIAVAGRLYSLRRHGKTAFADLGDQSGRVQLYLRKNDLGDEAFSMIKDCVDTGDIVGVEGHVFRTKTGEITVWADRFEMLSKSLNPLPEKYHGLKNIETRYRQRYIDLIVNDEPRQIFATRSRIISRIRAGLEKRGFMECETPTLQPVYGGANARPFTTYHNYLDQKLYMRIAPELYLKRLVVGGFEKVFEIAKNFRNEDVDTSHNPEFTMVEIYEAYSDFNDMMDLTEELISGIVNEIAGGCKIEYDGNELDFTRPWRRISMEEAVTEYAGIDVMSMDMEGLRDFAEKNSVPDYGKAGTKGEFLALLFEEFAEDKLIQPTFIHDFPVETSPLAKRHREKEGFTERFELFINGLEIANGFSELNDAIDQMERFEAQDEKRRHGDLEAQMIDYDFVTALGYGMPPTGGVGIGIDRLVMLITGNTSIKEVILFPSMKTLSRSEQEEEVAPEGE